MSPISEQLSDKPPLAFKITWTRGSSSTIGIEKLNTEHGPLGRTRPATDSRSSWGQSGQAVTCERDSKKLRDLADALGAPVDEPAKFLFKPCTKLPNQLLHGQVPSFFSNYQC
jgi:hypothetical protein